jgi:hypothetical protein
MDGTGILAFQIVVAGNRKTRCRCWSWKSEPLAEFTIMLVQL